MPRIFFINRFFHPDLSATSQMLTDLAAHLASEGQPVQVVTSRLSYEDPAITFAPKETVFGVDVVRVATTRFGRARLLGRAFDYASFYLSVFWYLLRTLRQGDLVVAKTDPPLVSVVAALTARLKGARLVNWLQDVFPEVGAALGVGVLSGLSGGMLRRLRDASLRFAVANVVLGERMATYVCRRVPGHKGIVVIPNWADDKSIIGVEHGANPLRREWAWEGMFVVAYSGNLGRAHDVATVLEAARQLAPDPRIRFAFIGGGAKTVEARRFVSAHDLRNIEFLPYQPRERLALSLGAADLHLVSLLAEAEGYIVPSKFYGIAAAGRPVAFVGDPEGEVGTLIARFDCGFACKSGDSASLARFIVSLADSPNRGRQMGANIRAALDRDFSQARSLGMWSDLILRLEGRQV